jgi:protein ImuB
LLRLDQAVGKRPELLTPLPCRTPVESWVDFDFPIRSQEGMQFIYEGLVDRVLAELRRRGTGARQLEIVCLPDRSFGREPTRKRIALTRACRDRKTLLHLIFQAIDQLGCDREFVKFGLKVASHERISGGEQTAAFGTGDGTADMEEIDRLTDRLRLRLGEAAVIRPRLVESHLPERAWQTTGGTSAPVLNDVVRPICLLPMPLEIRVVCEPSDDRIGSPRQFVEAGNVHRLTHVVGPERISGEWWCDEGSFRDYYDVEDEQGQRFWIFRTTPETGARWFLQGCF